MGEDFTFTITAGDFIDLDAGQVSMASPIGRGLLGATEGEEVVIGWSVEPGVTATLPRAAVRAANRDGRDLSITQRSEVELGPSPVYYSLGSD